MPQPPANIRDILDAVGPLSEEHEDDRRARIARENKDHTAALVKDYAIFGVSLCALVAAMAGAAYFGFIEPSTDPEIKSWARTAITTISASVVTYFWGRSSK